ncbi:MAG: Lrp/AsnC family transcriptional regulator [Solirubrobacterales bacterium]|nr:Lrp/AsnC family transcriptional regulator [Solirubrobacterales bacterium]
MATRKKRQRPTQAGKNRSNLKPYDFDEIDRQLVAMLQEDGRRTYAEMAKAVGLSEPAARQRVNRMREAGALQIVAVTDPLRMGFRRMGMIGIRTQGDLEKIADQLGELGAVEYIIFATGTYDLLVEVVSKDEEELVEILRTIREIPGVTSTETFVYLRIHKQTFAWGAR